MMTDRLTLGNDGGCFTAPEIKNPFYRLSGRYDCTVRLGKAKFDSFQSTLIKPKLRGPQGLYARGAHTKFQLPTCKWARETLG